MRPEPVPGPLVALLVLLTFLAGCSRVTFLRPDVSRGDFRRTAPEVEIRNHGGARAGAMTLVTAAQTRLQAGDASGALDAARRAIRADASIPEAHSLAALSLDALGRHGEAEDAAALGAFLLSDEAGWVTGQVIALDGGFQAVRPMVRAG